MGRKRTRNRGRGRISVYEPSRHGRRWRFEIRDGVTGERSRPSFASKKEAWKAYWEARQTASEYQGATVGEVIDKYELHLKAKGNQIGSVNTTIYRLESFFTRREMAMSRFPPKKMKALYEDLQNRMSVDTHRNTLSEVKSFGKWCVDRKYWKTNPAEDIKGEGARKKGKPQLRAAEAKKLLDRALELSAKGEDGAFAVAVALVLGLRDQAIARRVVRDVDPLTHWLYIEGDKTAAGNRPVEIPDILWSHFKQRIQDKKPTDAILPAPASSSGFRHRGWVRKNTLRLCKELELPEICAHGLRGTHSTLAEEAGATGHLVAKQLGHEDPKTTRANYTKPGTVEKMKRKKALEVLTGGKK